MPFRLFRPAPAPDLAEHTPAALAAVGRDGRLIAANAALRRMVPAAEPGAPVEVLTAPAQGPELRAAALARFAPGAGPTEPLRLAAAGEGDSIWAYALSVLPAPSGAPAAAILHISDVSAETRLAARLAEAERLHEVGSLAGGVAHDFNNLLTAIQGAVAALESGAAPAEELATIRAAAARGAELARQLLAVGRQQPLRPRVIDAAASVGALAGLLRRTLPASIRLETDLEAGVLPVLADPGELDRAVLNLAVNARNAMSDGGRILLRAARTTLLKPLPAGGGSIPPGTWAEIAVEDTGPGIPAEILPRIFDPFFTTRRGAGGSGLGLATVLGVMRQSGGHVRAESPKGEGARLRLFLPIADAAPEPAAAPATPVEVPRTAATILFVEDEDSVRRVMVRALERAGFRVLPAADGEAALALIEAGAAPDAVITDMMMPGMDGAAVVRALRERRPGLPALIVSGYAEGGAPRELLDQPRTSWLTKPYTPAQLSAGVVSLLG